MTKLRALYGALACGAVSLAVGGPTHAAQANYTIDPGSSQSVVDNACVGALPGATGEDCTYNQSNPAGLPPGSPWVGPVRGGGYYLPGNSPFITIPVMAPPLSPAPVPDPNNVELAVTGTLLIDDINGTECDGDDTIQGRIALPAGTRTFSGGPGTTAEETWGDNTIVYVLPATAPDFQNPQMGGGCEYIIGDKGFPALIQTMGSFNGVQTYPADLSIGADPIDPNDGEQDAWAAPEPSGIGVGRFEASNFDGNNGVAVTLDETVFFAGSWQCVDNFGDVNAPTAEVAGGQCTFGPNSNGTPCTSAGSHFCGTRGIGDPNFIPATTPNDGKGQENWIIRILVAANGDITDARIFANNESVVFATPPAPSQNNSWDGPLIDFTATCLDCSVAKDDTYNFVTGTNDVVPLPIGANDDTNGELNPPTTDVMIDAPGPTRGVCTLTGTRPGDITQIGCDYDSNDAFATAGVDTFTYTIDDMMANPALGLTATVTVNVETNDAPVANDFTITFDSQGVDPVTLRNTTDVLTGVAGNAGGNNTAVSVGAATSGTTSVDDTEITYAANAGFFSGIDTFTYTIDDDNFMSPGVSAQSATGTVTVDIPNVVPTASDVSAEVEAGEDVDILATITAGNGTVAQHTVDATCDDGDLVVNGVGVNGALLQVDATYTAPAGFAGEDTCTYTVTDENGAGDAADGVVTITVTESGIVIKLPGAGSALGPWSLALLLLIPLLRSRFARRVTTPGAIENPGVK